MRPTGRGGRGRGHQGAGPLMTNHLEDLDRELEILRRKREVIQQEQQLLSMECEMDRKRQYNEQYINNPSYLYGNPWEPSPPKRINEHPARGRQWGGPGHSMSKPMPSNFIPPLFSKKVELPSLIQMAPGAKPFKPIVHPLLRHGIGQRLTRPAPVARKDFNPSRVTKLKPRPPPNKLNSYPAKDRANFVSKALAPPAGGKAPAPPARGKVPVPPAGAKAPAPSAGAKAPAPQAGTKPPVPKPALKPEDMILREDRVPNRQVSGRLELALGNIVKDIKTDFACNSSFNALFASSTHQRVLKQAVRDRIRNVMLNQKVGPASDIIQRYRAKYPKSTDKDIVDLVVNTKYPETVTADEPEEFFKTNITPIFKKKMLEMFTNLKEMYASNRRNNALAITKAAVEANKIDKPIEGEANENLEKALKTLKHVTIEERVALTHLFTGLVENIVEEKIIEHLPLCMPHCLRIFDMDREYRAVKFMAVKRVREENKLKKAEQKAQQNKDGESENIIIIEDDGADESKNASLNESPENSITDKTASAMVDMTASVIEEASVANDAIDVNEPAEVNRSIDAKEPNDSEMQVTNGNKPCENEKENTVEAKPEVTENTEVTPSAAPKNISPATPKTPGTPAGKELPYYVKLIGRPKLPAKNVICDFMNKYHPTSIKKHKTISNLLVVGFVDEEDYNGILMANETVLDDTTIIIKANEKANSGKDNDSTKDGNVDQKESVEAMKETPETPKNVTDSKKDENVATTDEIKVQKDPSEENDAKAEEEILGNDLEDQITNLLSTIRESEYETDKSANKNNENEDKTNSSKAEGDSPKESDNSAKRVLEPIKEDDKNGDTQSDKTDKGPKANVKETAKGTPSRNSSRLANVTPSTIRTRRASRLMQE